MDGSGAPYFALNAASVRISYASRLAAIFTICAACSASCSSVASSTQTTVVLVQVDFAEPRTGRLRLGLGLDLSIERVLSTHGQEAPLSCAVAPRNKA